MSNVLKHAVVLLGLVLTSSVSLAGGSAKDGKAKTAVCGACHGEDGNSASPMYPKLAGLGEAYLLKQLKDVKSGARVIPEMTGLLDNLSESDLEDIAAYFNSKAMQLTGAKPLKVRVNSGAEVDALKLGARVYRGGNKKNGVPACMGCHSPTGQGNAPAGYPRLSGQYAEYVEKQLKAFRGGERTNDGDKMTMRQVAAQLSDAELTAVANYVSGLH